MKVDFASMSYIFSIYILPRKYFPMELGTLKLTLLINSYGYEEKVHIDLNSSIQGLDITVGGQS
jgi:hypothetical protein